MREADMVKQKEYYFYPEKLILFRNIACDPLIKKAKELLELIHLEPDNYLKRDNSFYHICTELVKMAEYYHWTGNLWQHFLALLIIQAENTFTRISAWSRGEKIDPGMMILAAHDMKYLKQIWDSDFRTLGDWVPLEIINTLEDFTNTFTYPGKIRNPQYKSVDVLQRCLREINDPTQMAACLTDFYQKVGYGKVGLFSSFHWQEEEGLVGIPYPDQIKLKNLIGYEHQKRTIINNTKAFVSGKKANNMLLYGERGTGKSSTIKALVNEYYTQGLRLLEVTKAQFANLSVIIRNLREYPQRFLIFIDDLSFESNETEYKQLKYILEGGMEILPDNVVIYATSNRRHLVQESWHDREGGGEVRIHDSVSEKLSLADRFGITVTYTSPDQEEYLKIVVGLAEQNGLDIPLNELREKALQWERWHNGRSGRTAKQFINSLSSHF
ncbi:MAG: ATP-binding protein [Dehalobacterium sp.]